jgi:hypothetical protein
MVCGPEVAFASVIAHLSEPGFALSVVLITQNVAACRAPAASRITERQTIIPLSELFILPSLCKIFLRCKEHFLIAMLNGLTINQMAVICQE